MSLVHLRLLRFIPFLHPHIHIKISVLQSIRQIIIVGVLIQPLPRNQIRHQSLRLVSFSHSYRRKHRNCGRRTHQRRGPQRKRRQRGHHGSMQSAHADATDNEGPDALLVEIGQQRARLHSQQTTHTPTSSIVAAPKRGRSETWRSLQPFCFFGLRRP